MHNRGPGRRLGSSLLEGFLAPFEDIQLDQYESDQPEHRIPEVDEISSCSPIDGREQERRIENDFEGIAQLKHQAFEAISFLQLNIDFQNKDNEQPHRGVDHIDPGKVTNIGQAASINDGGHSGEAVEGVRAG